MDRLQKLHQFCVKADPYPTNAEIRREMERLLDETPEAKEFTLFPFAFKAQEDFRIAVQQLWDTGFQAIVSVRKGERHGG